MQSHCDLARHETGRRPSMRQVATRSFMAVSALYSYFPNKEALEQRAESRIWSELSALLIGVPLEQRLCVAFEQAPGWMWLISELTPKHPTVDTPVALTPGADPLGDPGTTIDEHLDWLLGFIGCAWVHTATDAEWVETVLTAQRDLDTFAAAAARETITPLAPIHLIDTEILAARLASFDTTSDVGATIATIGRDPNTPTLRAVSRTGGVAMSSLHHRSSLSELANEVAKVLENIFVAEVAARPDLVTNGLDELAAAWSFWWHMSSKQPGLANFLMTARGIELTDGSTKLLERSASERHRHTSRRTIAWMIFGTTSRLARRQDGPNAADDVAAQDRIGRLLALTAAGHNRQLSRRRPRSAARRP